MDEIISLFKVKRNIINALLLLVMVAALPLGINLARQQQILRSRAAGDPIKFTGQNVEKRNDKWVAIDRNKPITLELISSLGPAGGGSGGSNGGGGNSGGGTGNSGGTWQSPDMKFQSKVPFTTPEQVRDSAIAVMDQAGKTGSSAWSPLFDWVASPAFLGDHARFITPQQATAFLNAHPTVRAWWKKEHPNDDWSDGGIIHAWLPGAIWNAKTDNWDRDGIEKLLRIAHSEDGQGISNPDQIIAMFPEVKGSIIRAINSPEGSEDWPATCFLREWMKIGPNDPNAKLARKVMQQMPGQVGFDDAAIAKGCDFDSHKIKKTDSSPINLNNLMSLIPKGLVETVYAQICTEGDERFQCSGQQAGCSINSGEMIKYICKADLIFGDRTDWVRDSSYCDPSCASSLPVVQCLDNSCNGEDCEANGGKCDINRVPCACSYAPPQKEMCDQLGGYIYCINRHGNNWDCQGGEAGPYSDGCIQVSSGPQICENGYYAECNTNDGHTGIFHCRPGKPGNDGTCKEPQWFDFNTNCYDYNPLTGKDGKINECILHTNGGTPEGSPPPGGQGGKTCSFEGKTLKPGDYAYKCIANTKCPSDGTAGVGVPSVCNADGTTTVTNPNGECTFECKPGSGNVTPPPGLKTVPPSPSMSPRTSGSPSGSPGTSGSPGPSGSNPPGTVTTVSYKIAESPDELASAPENPYTGEPMIVNFNFKDKTPGNKFVWVEYKDSKGKTARHSAQIRLLGDDPKITGCKVNLEGSNATFEISGTNFGTDRGTVNSGSSSLQIQDWKNDKVKVSGGSAQTGQATPIALTNANGQKADGQCSAVSPLSLGAKTFCRAPSKHDQENVEITLIDEDGKKSNEKVRIDKDGNVQNMQTKLVEGKKYKVLVKAPKGLRRKAEFTAGAGTTNLANFVLPVGDIFPLESGDGKINSLDKAELNRQWVTAQSATGRSGDFNQDGRVNTIDWACMRFDFGKEDDKE